MQRPVMNPMFMEEQRAEAEKKRRHWQRMVRPVWIVLRFVGKVLLTRISLLGRQRAKLRIEDGTPLQRFVRAVLYRLAFLPVALVLFIVSLVLAVTHPPHAQPESDPLTHGVYYDPVNFLSEDGTRLEGWLVPVYEAKRVLEEKEKVLTRKHPAVVLLHDFDGSREQVLPLVQPLHDAGMVVLVVGLRGSESGRGAGHTFGLREVLDVRAAVQMLRRRAYVDPTKVCVFGLGTGANAAILAAEDDPAIAALVLDRPVDGFASAFSNRVGESYRYMHTLMPLFEWTFEMMYHVDTDRLSVASRDAVMEARPVLLFDALRDVGALQPQDVRGVQEFLRFHTIVAKNETATASVANGG
ncbi:MAG: hypothetical protein H0T11_06890 [Chthoniobacterales bacterium]|nr:hypothetical protein [Chthoniobacterales bacterium]